MRVELPFTPVLAALPASTPFVGPETMERRHGRAFELRLGANESAFGVSPRAAEAMHAALARISWYGDPEGHDLRHALGALHAVAPGEICLAGGIDELLGLSVRLFVQPGTPVVTSLGGYPTFAYHVAGHGGVLQQVAYRGPHEDLQALAERVHASGAPLVYLANPDNPMGTCHDAEAVGDFIAALPATTALILDEAYIEFAPPGTAPPIDTGDPRVIRMRTFSKAHGMAGARIGYCIAAPEVVTAYGKVRNHFGINRVALAGALASLEDTEFVAAVVREVAAGREDYYRMAAERALQCVPSATNFVAIDLGSGERARALLAALEARGVFIRMPAVAPLDRHVRVSVGTRAQRARFAAALDEVLATLPDA